MQSEQDNWPAIAGTATRTRVVKETSNRMPYIMFRGECLVEYSVRGKFFSLWTPAGPTDPDENWVRDRMEVCPVARFVVQYNPKNPAHAIAKASK